MIPLALLVGFLGAGKTRFLTNVIPELHARGLRPRVILNDFVNADIDASRLAELDALVTPLNGECVCCTSLRELMDTLKAVEGRPGDVMLIEANGATEADELLGYLSMDRRLGHFTLPLQVTVIDAARWQRRWWHNALEAAQTRTATHVMLNWTDGMKAARLDKVEASVRQVNARAELTSPDRFAATLASVSLSSRDVPTRVSPASELAPAHVHAHAHAHAETRAHPFASATLPLPALVDRATFEAFVRTLPDSVVRAKGLVRFADQPALMFVWNRVSGRKQVLFDASAAHADAQPVALFIGVALEMEEIAERVRTLASPRL